MDDDSLLSNTPPSAKRQKKAPVVKRSAAGVPLASIDNESFGLDGASDMVRPITKKSEKYQKLTQLEHILKRPDTYIGSVEQTQQQMWVYNSDSDSMESREVNYVPGLYKIFDEILVNAADNKQRDKNMDEIKVTIDRESGEISVRNNGRGIPIEIHEKEQIYIPEMIFGHLLTSSNYDDDEAKVTGGRNGYGAKLCNVYSSKFILETSDSKTKQKYKQTWTNNMSVVGKASITAHKGDDYTKITFYPDFKRFGMKHMDVDFEALVKRRVYDMAGTCKDVKVSLNGERIKVRNFKKYMEMYTKAIKTESKAAGGDDAKKETQVILTDNPNERWEIGFAVSDGSFQQVSFVNSIATTSGGTHVNYIADQVVTKLLEIVKKKNKGGVALKNSQIRNHIFLFVNCQIVNPAFNSQTKEQLTTKASQFGSNCVVSDKFLKEIAKSEAVNNIIEFAQHRADKVLAKSDGSKRSRMNHSKLTDANKAGTRDGHQCTLILTEGDSASLLALAGRAVVDPDRIGVFPLRGKLLNVRDASVEQISKNAELQNIKKFMGLQHKKHYEDTKSLRYGHLMIMTDQDHDGSHIKGLLINFIEVSFPSLLKLPGFLQEFITPIVKVWKGDVKNPKRLQSFFTMPEYEVWKQVDGNQRGWDHKYFKGLGTSSPSDAEIYFRDLDMHLKEFATMKPEEPELIDLAFSKKKADARKEWLRQFRPGTFLDMRTSKITYTDFINKELILFSMADNERSIPSVIDGFKPGQRKVLYTCFRRNLKKDVKVVELAGSVSGLTAYSYGETSLQQTIVGLAQNFVGSNNINCLEPSGNFGSRLQGGSDAASARYIYTRLSPFARKIFNQADEALLEYNLDDGKEIEPKSYIPILPMILVNGADGIGTGWSTSIPNYSPEDIVENLKLRMAGSGKDDMRPMKPWFRGFKGEIEDIGNDRFRFSGIIQKTGDNEVEITELPVRLWTQDFKDRLEDIIKAEKTPSFIKDYTEYNTPVRVHFIIHLDDKHMNVSMEKGLEDAFKLSRTMATTNLVAFDAEGRIHKYATPLDIMEEFYGTRMEMYEKRKRHLLAEIESELERMNNQARFIQMIINGKLVISRKKKQALVNELREQEFKAIPKIIDAKKQGEFEPTVNEDEDTEEMKQNQEVGAADYDYLLGMAIWSLTQERIDRLLKQVGDKEAEHKVLIDTSPKQLWDVDLDAFIEEWRFQLDDEAKRAKKAAALGRRASTKLRIGGKAGAKKRKADDSDNEEFAVSKPKKQAKGTNSLFNFLTSKVRSPSPTPKEDLKAEILSPMPTAPPKAPSVAPVTAPVPRSKPKRVIIDDEDSDVDMVDKPMPTKIASQPARTARGGSRQPISYKVDLDESDDNLDELLGDVTNMVKGIPQSATEPRKSLLHSAPRPSSSHGLMSNSKPKPAVIPDEDETDYTKLVPRDSPQKPAARAARDVVASDDDDDIFLDLAAPKTAPKLATKAGSAKPVPVPKVKRAPIPKAPVQKATKTKTATLTASEPRVLSPAAKAYAAKQAKSKSAASQPAPKLGALKSIGAAKNAKKIVESESESEDEEDEAEDLDALADRILDNDDDESEINPVKSKGRATSVASSSARPSRRAATATKSRYVQDDDDDESEEDVTMDDFGDDDE